MFFLKITGMILLLGMACGDALAASAPATTNEVTEPATPQGQDTTTPGMVITRPVPESAIAPRLVPRPESPAAAGIRKDAEDNLAARAEELSDACGSTIKARIDWTRIDPMEIDRNSPFNACNAALDAIQEICASTDAKPRVGTEIKQVICTAGNPPSVSLHGGTLVYTLDWQSRNPGAFVYAWLASHL